MVTPAKPNIVVILADDLGYDYVGCYVASLVGTPYTDRIVPEAKLRAVEVESTTVSDPNVIKVGGEGNSRSVLSLLSQFLAAGPSARRSWQTSERLRRRNSRP